MPAKLIAALAAFGLLAVPATASSPPPITRPASEAGLTPQQLGQQLYAPNCSTCHGLQGEGVLPGQHPRGVNGVPGAGPPLRGVGALAADFYLRTGYMPLGHPGEQPKEQGPRFDPKEIRAITAYVASLGGGPAIPQPDPAAGNLSDGERLFAEHCAGCHQIVAEGGVVTGARVPPLGNVSPRTIWEAVRIGPYVMPTFGPKSIPDRDLNSIIRYVQYAQHPDDRGGWSIGHLGPFSEGLVAWGIAIAVLLATCMAIGERARRA
jgi:ubiquinol-cytochrome c reductase cytochrome c subunit